MIHEAEARAQTLEWIFIDEVQKVPKILDVVHLLLESKTTKHICFALTGSSARKLKLVGANLLAGRAYVNELYPLTHSELADQFSLEQALNWGTLPKVQNTREILSKQEFLRTYSRVYLKEEVWDQRLIHNLEPFRKFLEVAAQSNGTILNYSKLARQTGVDDKTIKKYFEILVDTFLGFYLESYSRSVRAQQIQSPKFYLFDPGVKRAMEGLLHAPIVPKTSPYGRAFEHFVLCECVRINSYKRHDYRFSYLKTKDDLEIDLIIERPGKSTLVVEIKSTDDVKEEDARTLKYFVQDFLNAEFQIWSTDAKKKKFDAVIAMTWQEGVASM